MSNYLVNELNSCEAPLPTPTPFPENDNYIYYNCSECSSLIEIISIDEENNMIEFKCLNKKNYHEKKDVY